MLWLNLNCGGVIFDCFFVFALPRVRVAAVEMHAKRLRFEFERLCVIGEREFVIALAAMCGGTAVQWVGVLIVEFDGASVIENGGVEVVAFDVRRRAIMERGGVVGLQVDGTGEIGSGIVRLPAGRVGVAA